MNATITIAAAALTLGLLAPVAATAAPIDDLPVIDSEHNQGKLDGARTGFTSMIDTDAPEIDTCHDDEAHMFHLKRYCGPGCGGHDWMTLYKVRDGYVLIWGTPRYDGDGDLYYEAVQ